MKESELKQRAASISFRQLRLFESVGRLASVRRGSDECNLSQPAVTQAIGKLEHILDVALFDRHASGSYLTEAGTIFHLRAQRLFRNIDLALEDIGANSALPIAHRLSRSQVRSLLAIIEFGSFAKAAEALELTPASLQRAARDLEGNLGKTLFHRTATGVMVTTEGLEFGRKLRLALQEIEWGIREIEVARGAIKSQMIIGTLPFGGSMLLASVLDEFVAAHRQADIRILTEGASEMIKRLRAGDVDLVLGIVQETTGQDLCNESFAQTPYQVVGRRGHPLAGRAGLQQPDLVAFDWVVGMEGSSRRTCFDALFEQANAPTTPIATSSLPIIRHLLANSDRLTLMTTYEVDYEGGSVIALDIDPPGPGPQIGVTTRADWLPTALHKNFVAMLRSRMARTAPEPAHA